MTIERWGSLSVADHVDTAALAANVLLYDRLVVPVMTSSAERSEPAYWADHGWHPDLQRKRLEELGDLVVCRPWDAGRREQFKTRLAEIRAETLDAQQIDAYGMTRRILAQEQVVERPPGVHHVDVVPAYNSADALAQDFELSSPRAHAASQALLLTRRLALPRLEDPEDSLMLARDLSRDADFRKKRAALYEWQMMAAVRGLSPEAAVAELAEMTDAYNDAVKAATRKVYWKFAFMVFGIGVGFSSGIEWAAAASAALSLVQFATFDKEPAIEPGRSAPAAMFHDVRARVGFRLEPA